MQIFEYKVIPAPRRGEKTKTARTTPDRFAHALSLLMNDLSRDGWEYIRADTLPCDERVGLTGRATTFQNMLVFRRPLETAALQSLPPLIEAPARLAVPAPPVAAQPFAAQPFAAPPVAAPPPANAAAGHALSDYGSLSAKPVARSPFTADAPSGEAPRISLVSSIPGPGPSVGPASGNGLAKS